MYDMHGNQAGQPAGSGNCSTIGGTFYGNEINKGDSVSSISFLNQRGGKALTFYNNVAGFTLSYMKMREEYIDTCDCEVSMNSIDGQPHHVSDSYLWNNRKNATGVHLITSITTQCVAPCYQIAENTAWWQQRTGAFDATGDIDKGGGVGCGTLSARPETCTIGVGYWATTQSCSDLTGMVGASPTTPISGTLYNCTATNVWTAYYTPFTYPHPLRNETASDTTAPAAPGGLSVQ